MRKKGLNGGKSEKNRRIVGGWRIGPKIDKNRPKEKGKKRNQTGPVNRTGPVQRVNRLHLKRPSSWLSLSYSLSLPDLLSSSSKPWEPRTFPHRHAYLLPRSLSTSSSLSLFQHTPFPKPETTPHPRFHLNRPIPLPSTTLLLPRSTFAGFHLLHPRHPCDRRSRDEGGRV